MAKTTKKPKKKIEVGKCINCIHAYLMQSRPENPIVCSCKLTEERHVAQVHQCNDGKFSQRKDDIVINGMIYL